MKYIIANWKSNKTNAEVQAWVKVFQSYWQKKPPTDFEVVLCPSFVHLAQLHDLLPKLTLGTQTISPYPPGAYTGAVAASMVKEYASFCLLGHVERRQFFNENAPMITNQALQALDNGLTPILAVNDLNWSTQLSQLSNEQLLECLVMYEPPEAISTNGQNHPADLEKVTAMAQLMTESYQLKGIVYGGSVSASTIKTYMSVPHIDGVVAGNASLDAAEFVELLKAL